MFSRLLALFVIVPAIELYLLIKLGTVIGAAETFAIILLTGIVGSYLAKSQGLSVWNRLQAKLNSGSVPGKELIDGVIILLSGALLITPGVLTDVVGLLGLIPATRALVRNFLKAKFASGVMSGNVRFQTFGIPGTNNGHQSSVSSDQKSSEPEITIDGQAKQRPERTDPGRS
ncbi:MAG: hypothetical protein BMS9Abin05_0972 [Rhodothermia bacterium]|nr:MAG: hypothetical protein BMS9Abin05_0972 [Rhodothermia bacterium]